MTYVSSPSPLPSDSKVGGLEPIPEKSETAADNKISRLMKRKISGAVKCMRYIAALFHAISILTGFGVMVLSIMILCEGKTYMPYLEAYLLSLSWVVFSFGTVILGVGSLGFYSSLTVNPFTMLVYFMLTIPMLLLQVVICFFFWTSPGKVWNWLDNTILSVFEVYGMRDTTPGLAATLSLDVLQITMNCCGFTDKTDWSNSSIAKHWTSIKTSTYPDSCCNDTLLTATPRPNWNGVDDLTPNDPQFQCASNKSADLIENYFYEVGCYNQLKTLITEYIGVITASLMLLALFELVVTLFGCYFISHSPRVKKYINKRKNKRKKRSFDC